MIALEMREWNRGEKRKRRDVIPFSSRDSSSEYKSDGKG